jgi:ABC-type Na+ transport system ATPase subunit NatA
MTSPNQSVPEPAAGCDVVADPAAVCRSIMLTGQFATLDDMLSGYENLVMFGRLMGMGKHLARVRAHELLAEFDLEAAARRRVGTYSGGMRRRIDIADRITIPAPDGAKTPRRSITPIGRCRCGTGRYRAAPPVARRRCSRH